MKDNIVKTKSYMIKSMTSKVIKGHDLNLSKNVKSKKL